MRAVRELLPGGLEPHVAAAWLRDDAHPVALAGAWAGGGAVLAGNPVRVADAAVDDPFALLDEAFAVDDVPDEGVFGGWFGMLGFGLGRRLEPVPPPPPRPAQLPPFALAFYDHVVRRDAEGRWWFEALWTPERAAALDAARDRWRDRLTGARCQAPCMRAHGAHAPVTLALVAPGAEGHRAAVAAGRERIAAGEVFQANLCLRLEAEFEGDPLALWCRGVERLAPAYAAYVGGPWGAVASLSPELFLRRRGREVVSEPIKGTAPDAPGAREALAASAKDRAENVMIADLVRNDLGRVCAYGSVEATALAEPRPASGVWHLVSRVRGTLRDGVGDGELVRAAFPPGSVTGAPKVQALRVIHELEATGREAYCGALGFASPVAGLELNVAIRTFEAAGGRLWLGAGGGVVWDSEPEGELREALDKARPLVRAVGLELDEPRTPAAVLPALPWALAEGRDRPDPDEGLLETVLVRDGAPVALAVHLARLTASAAAVGLPVPAGDLPARCAAAASGTPDGGRLRLVHTTAGTTVDPGPPAPQPARVLELRPWVLPGGLGAHKWADRRLLDALAADGTTPLLVDLDGQVLEAAHAAVLVRRGDELVAPPLDGRRLPSVSRARLLAAHDGPVTIAPLTLDDLTAADAVVLTSALRGAHPARLADRPALSPA